MQINHLLYTRYAMSANIIQESDPLGDSKSVFLVIGVGQVYSKLDIWVQRSGVCVLVLWFLLLNNLLKTEVWIESEKQCSLKISVESVGFVVVGMCGLFIVVWKCHPVSNLQGLHVCRYTWESVHVLMTLTSVCRQWPVSTCSPYL